ncbi:hypothetical protein AQF52_4433 [Streptomyces venezuelae]|nr:hypothetical protein AQF52_4433 [Streptomyces venezuelae]CUM39527.1 hypothetical protein BN2537_8019 [Streptomyces venezuelae]
MYPSSACVGGTLPGPWACGYGSSGEGFRAAAGLRSRRWIRCGLRADFVVPEGLSPGRTQDSEKAFEGAGVGGTPTVLVDGTAPRRERAPRRGRILEGAARRGCLVSGT